MLHQHSHGEGLATELNAVDVRVDLTPGLPGQESSPSCLEGGHWACHMRLAFARARRVSVTAARRLGHNTRVRPSQTVRLGRPQSDMQLAIELQRNGVKSGHFRTLLVSHASHNSRR